MKCYVDEAGTIEAKDGDAVALLRQDYRLIPARPLTPEELAAANRIARVHGLDGVDDGMACGVITSPAPAPSPPRS